MASPRRQRVLIVSSHPLFGAGLRSLLQERQAPNVEVVGMAAATDAALAALASLKPDIVIVDHDDKAVNREEFLARFVEGASPLRVVLVSLKETGPAVVYDRRSLAVSQVEEWLGGITAMTYHTPDAPQAAPDRSNRRHLVIVGVLIAITTVVVSLLLDLVGLLPVQASRQAVAIDNLFNQHFKVISFLFALVVVFLLYSVVVFRRKPGETGDGDHFEGHTGLEIAWTIFPLAAVLYFAYIGAQALADTRRQDPNALVVNVTASQWSWAFAYPDSGVTSTDLHLPVNRQVLLKLSSTDVIHSFWVPEFRVKQDALPGDELVKELRVTPSLAGTYKVRCAELCGRQHAYMESLVIVEEPAVFDAWIAQESQISADPVERGQKWASQFACVACHSVDGSPLVGPTWKGLYGNEEALADGTTVTVDDAYLSKSIVDPNAQVVQGFSPGVMPQDFGQRLSEEQIVDLIEYIKSLK